MKFGEHTFFGRSMFEGEAWADEIYEDLKRYQKVGGILTKELKSVLPLGVLLKFESYEIEHQIKHKPQGK